MRWCCRTSLCLIAVVLACSSRVVATETITVNTVMDHDVVVTSGHGIVVAADGITIDGNGHRIVFTGRPALATDPGGLPSGIRIAGRNRVTLKNFSVISGFANGIDVGSGTGNVVRNCTTQDSLYAGLTGSGVTAENNIFREPTRGLLIVRGTGANAITGNTVIGGRISSYGNDPGSFSNNRFLHQISSPAITVDPVARVWNAGQSIPFRCTVTRLDGTPATDSVPLVRTVPAETVTWSRSGNVITGSFVPSRAGTYSLVLSATDTAGNEAVKALHFLIGTPVARSVTYYLAHERPAHGQSHMVVDNDIGSLRLRPPTVTDVTWCNQWVQHWPNELPPTPLALLTSCDVKTSLQFNRPPAITGLERNGQFSTLMDATTRLPDSLAGMGTYKWSECTVGGVAWMLDYPSEWYFLAIKLYAMDAKWQTGNPARLSQAIFHYQVSATPEVREVSNPNLSLLAATATVAGGDGERLTFWGAGDRADVVVNNFPRPFREAATQINALAEARLSSGVVSGESTFTAIPLTIRPTHDAVAVSVTAWPTAAAGNRAWTERAVGAPGTVQHVVNGLTAQTRYQITANGVNLLQATADAQGNLAFAYGGAFPVNLTIGEVPVTAWTLGDIGSVGSTGSYQVNSGVWTVTGSGSDIWNTADGCVFVRQPVTGDVRITARVITVGNTNPWAKAGVMVRESTAAGSRHAFTCVTPANGVAFQRRLVTNGVSSHTAGAMVGAPSWVRLERIGNVLIGSWSSDGTTWREIRRETITMAAVVQVGLAVTSHANGSACTATFSQVDVVTVPSSAN